MNIILYYDACRHISYYNQAFKWQGGYVNITFNEKNNKSLSFMIMFLSWQLFVTHEYNNLISTIFHSIHLGYVTPDSIRLLAKGQGSHSLC